MNRVVVTGLGCITPIGSTVEDFRTALFAGATGIEPFPPYPEAPGETQGLRFTQSARVKDFAPRLHLDSGVVVSTDRTTQFAILAARQAARKARDFKESDRIRDDLKAKGVLLEDGPKGTTWKRG